MPREAPVVHWESTILCCGPSLRVGVASAVAFGLREPTPIPIPIPVSRLHHPPIHWSMLHSPCSPCSIYSPSGPSHATVGGTKTSIQTNDAVRVLILAHPHPRVLIWGE